MDQDLRALFGRALADEPAQPDGLAQEAIARGSRLRRRRGWQAGGAGAFVVALAGALALNLTPTSPTAQPVAPETVGAAMQVFSDRCGRAEASPDDEVAIFLTGDITTEARTALDERITAEPRIVSYEYETREHAYQKFRTLWKDSPDLVAAVKPEQMPESFRVVLTDAAAYPGFARDYRGLTGVDTIIQAICPPGSREGR